MNKPLPMLMDFTDCAVFMETKIAQIACCSSCLWSTFFAIELSLGSLDTKLHTD